MEKEPIVNADQDKKTDFYNDVLSKRLRPKITIEEPEMKNQGKETEPIKSREEQKDTVNGNPASVFYRRGYEGFDRIF